VALPYFALNIDVTDQAKQGLYGSFFSSSKIAAPTAIRDNGLYLAIRAMLPDISGNQTWDDINITTATVIASIDNPDLFPASGSFGIAFGPTSAGTLVNGSESVTITGSTAGILSGMTVSGNGIPAGTTATIAGSTVNLSSPATVSASGVALYFFNASSMQPVTTAAGTLQSSLNALPSITGAGGVLISQDDNDFIVTWALNGAQPLLTGNAASLYPASTIQIIEIQAGTAFVPEIQLIRIVQLPATLQNTFTPFPGAAASVVILTAGGSGVNNLQQITLFPVPYNGTWVITTSYGSTTVAYNVSAAALQAALSAITGTPAGTWLVTGNAGGPFNITNTTGTSIAALVINAVGLIVPVGMQGELNLATPGMVARFDALPAGTNEFDALLEVQIQFPGSDPQTILQVPVTVLKNVIRNGALVTPPYALGLTLAAADARYLQLANWLNSNPTALSVSAAGSSSVARGAPITTQYLSAAAGSAGYTYSLTLSTTGAVRGDIMRLNVSLPASANPTIDIVGSATEPIASTGSSFKSHLESVVSNLRKRAVL
jgi:hypothetical protein